MEILLVLGVLTFVLLILVIAFQIILFVTTAKVAAIVINFTEQFKEALEKEKEEEEEETEPEPIPPEENIDLEPLKPIA